VTGFDLQRHISHFMCECVNKPFSKLLTASSFLLFCVLLFMFYVGFSASTLLAGWQEGHLPVKNLSGGMLMKLSVWGGADLHMA